MFSMEVFSRGSGWLTCSGAGQLALGLVWQKGQLGHRAHIVTTGTEVFAFFYIQTMDENEMSMSSS